MSVQYYYGMCRLTDCCSELQRHTAVSCPAVLDMAAYTSTGTFTAYSTLYDAVAYVSHEGVTPTSGHYTATTRCEADNSQWTTHDDNELSACISPLAPSKTTFMVVYCKRKRERDYNALASQQV
jgi:hypothetical protein